MYYAILNVFVKWALTIMWVWHVMGSHLQYDKLVCFYGNPLPCNCYCILLLLDCFAHWQINMTMMWMGSVAWVWLPRKGIEMLGKPQGILHCLESGHHIVSWDAIFSVAASGTNNLISTVTRSVLVIWYHSRSVAQDKFRISSACQSNIMLIFEWLFLGV